MFKKLFSCNRAGLVTGFLIALSLTANCGGSQIVVSPRSENAVNKTGNRPATPSTNMTGDKTAPAPLDLSNVRTVTYCDLIREPALYDRQTVRLRAVYFTAFEKMYLYDERCEKGQPPAAPEKVPAETWAEWDKSFVSKGDSEEAKLNRELNGFGRKDVILIGRFNSTAGNSSAPDRFGHLNCCRYQFQILRAEKAINLQDK